MSSMEIDRSEWPLVIYHFEGQATDEIAERYVEAVEENLRRAEASGERYVGIVVSDSLRTTAANRAAVASSIEGHSTRISEACRGTALVTKSTISRGLLTALRWMMTMPVEVRVFATVDEAKVWARAQLEQGG